MSNKAAASSGDPEDRQESLYDRIGRLIAENKEGLAVCRLRAATGLGLSECTRVINALEKANKDVPRW